MNYLIGSPFLWLLDEQFLEQLQGRAGGGNGVLRIQWQDNKRIHSVRMDLFEHLLCVRIPISHGEVALGI